MHFAPFPTILRSRYIDIPSICAIPARVIGSVNEFQEQVVRIKAIAAEANCLFWFGSEWLCSYSLDSKSASISRQSLTL